MNDVKQKFQAMVKVNENSELLIMVLRIMLIACNWISLTQLWIHKEFRLKMFVHKEENFMMIEMLEWIEFSGGLKVTYVLPSFLFFMCILMMLNI